jgi:hypothetical protein
VVIPFIILALKVNQVASLQKRFWEGFAEWTTKKRDLSSTAVSDRNSKDSPSDQRSNSTQEMGEMKLASPHAGGNSKDSPSDQRSSSAPEIDEVKLTSPHVSENSKDSPSDQRCSLTAEMDEKKMTSPNVNGNSKDLPSDQRSSPTPEMDNMTSRNSRGNSRDFLPSEQKDSSWSHFTFALRFMFTILPVDEIRFVCVTLPHDIRMSFQNASFRVEGQKAEGITTIRGVNTGCVQNGRGVEKDTGRMESSERPSDKAGRQTGDTSNTRSNNNGNNESQNRARSWELRGWVRKPVLATFSFARVCAVPVWACLLSVEYLFLLMVYGVVFLLFKDDPLTESGGASQNWLLKPYRVFKRKESGRDVRREYPTTEVSTMEGPRRFFTRYPYRGNSDDTKV